MLAKVIGAAAAILGPVGGLWVYIDTRFAKKSQVDDVKIEATTQRGHIGKLFDKLEEHSRRDEELAREIIGTMSTNHAEILRELGHKADR